MRANRAACMLLLFCAGAVLPSLAEQDDAEKRPLADNKAKAKAGDAKSQFELGRRYDKGEGVPRDLVEAAKWYRKRAEKNSADAQTTLGACYGNGEGVAQHLVEAVKWFRKAAGQNYAEGQ